MTSIGHILLAGGGVGTFFFVCDYISSTAQGPARSKTRTVWCATSSLVGFRLVENDGSATNPLDVDSALGPRRHSNPALCFCPPPLADWMGFKHFISLNQEARAWPHHCTQWNNNQTSFDQCVLPYFYKHNTRESWRIFYRFQIVAVHQNDV